ncbi:DUF1330 domain-containing protein [Rhizobium ruizarguesonis]|jgi:uncharacterized protein (DUF1330 family)|uniref:DUF1330 domain-containing protein n=1 Tax=Rhizobium ruizarguesonis TaxID=2081791 RepID=A0AAE8QCE3_9HYPH|nr:DUF1330 domain-containing protein [Rhizobium ruizarguesonis]MBY5804183.1 DUF1330 domain-containing protein [Rhizobium leguminosarum]NKJ73519.1 DUF1330 domain-containing protein [Rhizobium leguminosarum bv. viciae]QIO43848.1 DUF1330 domain-containing protein [Rhizobium leguminosarum bv. trifolii]QJS27307.1 DUF1330 domain-containing protein [Rhizobium leguminosarum bv. trifolii TA1]MBY5831117.1 DUF1330 domain-containing protein [Rhizobium leguminosarum]
MSAYLVVDLDIHDPEAIADYRSKALPLVVKAGGRLIALDDAPLELEGWQATNMLIIEFLDMDAIRGLFASPEYAPLAHQRQASAGSRIIALRGV